MKDKERIEFIKDMLFIGTGVSLLYVSQFEKFSEGVRVVQKNKFRKNSKIIKQAYIKLEEERRKMHDAMDMRDLRTLNFKTKALGTVFINTISTASIDVSLEYIAISILELGLTRKRKHPIRKELGVFCDYKTLYSDIGLSVEKSGIEFDIEFEISKKFVESVRY